MGHLGGNTTGSIGVVSNAINHSAKVAHGVGYSIGDTLSVSADVYLDSTTLSNNNEFANLRLTDGAQYIYAEIAIADGQTVQ